jgi:hypothetical protein
VPGASGFCNRYPGRVVRSSSFEVGGHIEHGPIVDEESTTKQEADLGDSLESCIGKAQSLRLAVPDTAFRLRALYDCVPAREAAGTRSGSLGKGYRASPTARLSHPALKDLRFWGELPQHLRHSRIWPEMTKPTVTIHTDASMSAYGATLAHGDHDAGTRGYYECRGYWQGSHKEIAHITMLELTTV